MVSVGFTIDGIAFPVRPLDLIGFTAQRIAFPYTIPVRTLAADPGAVAVAGGAAGLRYGRGIRVLAGAYAVTGRAAGLVYYVPPKFVNRGRCVLAGAPGNRPVRSNVVNNGG